MALTPKQAAFVDEYLKDFNMTQAAIRAGYAHKSAGTQAYALCQKPEIQVAIAMRIKERAQRVQLDQDRVLLEIARLAFNDPRLAFTEDGRLHSVHDWPAELAAAVASVKVIAIKDANGDLIGETQEVRFWDKGKQLALAARHLGLLHDKLEVSSPIAQLLQEARERVRKSAID